MGQPGETRLVYVGPAGELRRQTFSFPNHPTWVYFELFFLEKFPDALTD